MIISIHLLYLQSLTKSNEKECKRKVDQITVNKFLIERY